jgi:hypothetical protein
MAGRLEAAPLAADIAVTLATVAMAERATLTMSPPDRNTYGHWIAEARRAPTRARPITSMIERPSNKDTR